MAIVGHDKKLLVGRLAQRLSWALHTGRPFKALGSSDAGGWLTV